jgi:hypothetical protein
LPCQSTWLRLYPRSQTGFFLVALRAMGSDVCLDGFPMLAHPVATPFGLARAGAGGGGRARLRAAEGDGYNCSATR